MKVSIITVTFNSALYLENTIQSVINQTYHNIEYIVVDGNSTDGTHKILNKYVDSIDKIIIEDDGSMYEAINKGIIAATGDVIAILNSDDMMASARSVELIAQVLADHNVSGCFSNVINCYGQEKIIKKVFGVNLKEYITSGKGTFIPHTSLYLKRHVFDDIGLYDLNYKYAADFDFIIRVLKKYELRHIDKPLFIFRRHAGSITSSGKIKAERIAILNKYSPKVSGSFLLKWWLWSKYYIRNVSVKNFLAYIFK